MEERLTMGLKEIIGRCEDLYYDLSLSCVRDWKERAGGKAIGYLPVYAPRELIHAAGMLPVGVMGGGDQIEIIRGDSYYQSYICHLPRSVVEMGLAGHLDALDGMLFPSICDVIRNLSGMWQILFPDKYAHYFDTPQNFDDEVGGVYYIRELRDIAGHLAEISGREITPEGLNQSIALYNETRDLVQRLYQRRAQEPWTVPTSECYLLLRAGNLLPVEEFNELLTDYLKELEKEKRRPLDNARVVLCGAFCEQPPLGLIRTMEGSGCYIVNDDFVLITRWMQKPLATDSPDPIEVLADAFLHHSTTSAVKFLDQGRKGDFLLEQVREAKADGVIFCAPSFCDPALLEQPMLQAALEREGVAYTQFKYSENTGQFQIIGEQTGTFADSIKLWGSA